MSLIVYGILPYVTLVIFVAGVYLNLRRMARTGATGIKFIIFPAAGQRYAADVAKEILLFPSIFATNKRFWLLAWGFHLTLLLLFLGHWRVVTEFGFLWNALGLAQEQVDAISKALGSAAGIALLVTVVLLLLRRFTPNLLALSVTEDYILLLLIIGLAVSGNAMRFGMDVDLEQFRRYFASLAVFRPQPPDVPAFTAHFLLAQLLLIYFPFSKLMHVINVFRTLKYKRS